MDEQGAAVVVRGATASIEVPPLVASGDLTCIVSISGGKDSTACALALREAGISFRMVFADTGWEAPETYAHLDHLRERLGPIDVVGVEGGMVAKIRHRAGFPARMQRWCTRELKLEPLRAYHDRVEAAENVETCSVMGVRGAESESRSKMEPFVDEPVGDRSWGGWIWRPILRWSVEDVLAIHHRHGVKVNPLYKLGHGRVGCYPCIFANKEQVRLLAEHAPWRVDEIRQLEDEVVAIRQERNRQTPGRYEDVRGSFFQSTARNGFTPIEEVVLWARTDRGGRQLPLLPPAPTEGCARWGMCEPPTTDVEEMVSVSATRAPAATRDSADIAGPTEIDVPVGVEDPIGPLFRGLQ
jgi:3'-phosphoadenosine 5'-phosphosulfate sulfotransferase (PAPS reductase)/FAD synthetase